MGLNISELRADQVASAADFVKGLGVDVAADLLRNKISLMAWDGETLVGGAVTCEVDEGRYDLYVGFDSDKADLELARKLADKALQKVHAQGIHSCRIIPIGPADCREFWQQVNWLEQLFADDAA